MNKAVGDVGKLWETHRWRLIGAAVGLLFGLVYLIAGFFKTIVFGLFVGIGYWIGYYKDGREDLRDVVQAIIPEKWLRK